MIRNTFLERDILNVIVEEEAIFNGTSHPINLVKSDGFIGRGRTLRIAEGRPFEVKEICVTRRLYIREDNFEIDSNYVKVRMPSVDFDFGRVSNEEAEMYKKIVVSKKYADNIKNVISSIARNCGPFSQFMFSFISQNQFIRKLYVPYGRVVDNHGNLIGCSSLEKAVVLPFENFEWIFKDFSYGGNFYKTLTEDEKIFISLEYKNYKNKYMEALRTNQFANQCPVVPMQMQQDFLNKEYFIKNILFGEQINPMEIGLIFA